MAIVKKEGLAAEIREKRVRAKWVRAKYVSQRAFLRRWVPGLAPRVEECETKYRILESTAKPGRYIAVPQRCNELPWCIPCVQYREWKRVQKALQRFERCTPRGEQPRFIHIVQTAPVLPDHTGWGMDASRDVKRFRKVVWETIKRRFPGDVGAIFSYQDFGEQGFAKRHPHIDLTLNGWKLEDGKPVKVQPYELRSGGRARWNDTFAGEAARAGFTGQGETGDAHFSRVAVGVVSYRQALHYQMREVVDLRKLEYNEARREVYWWSYHDNTRTKFPVFDWKAALAEYQWRLGQWPMEGEKGKSLHSRHGHMSDRRIRSTQIAMGGDVRHPDDCHCGECEEWQRAFPDI